MRADKVITPEMEQAQRETLEQSFDSLEATVMKVKRDRDELLAACKAIESCLAPEDNDYAARKVRAAIARAESDE